MDLTQVGTRLFFTRPERGEDRDTAKSALASGTLHLILILLVIFLTRAGVLALSSDQGVGTGIGAGVAGGGGGGGREEQVSILLPEPPPPTPEAPQLMMPQKIEEIPPPEVKPAEVALAKADTAPASPIATPASPTGGSGGGAGPGQGMGAGAGAGPGSGGGSGGGEGGGIGSGVGSGTGKGRIIAPSPEVLLIPPSAPGGVRGKTVVVRLAVDSVGVVKDAEIIPSTGDRKFDATLKRTALGWHFRAARDPSNRAINVLYDVTFTF